MIVILRIYGLLLRLYPRAFRALYADEMREVFASTLADAQKRGGTTIVMICIRELRDLPICALKEHRETMTMKALILRLSMLAIVVCIALALPVIAQTDDIVLTVSLSYGMEYLEQAGVFDRFEEENPGVLLHFLYPKPFDYYAPPPEYDFNGHLDGTDRYTATADVLIAAIGEVYTQPITFASAAAGYWLDLAPLIAADPTFDPNVFYPAAWESVQWNNGVWMLPLTAMIYVPRYDPAVFDAAGVPYPDENWTLEDYVRAIEAVTPRDPNGTAQNPGFIGYNYSDRALFYTFLGDLADDSGLPDYDRAEVVGIAEHLIPLYTSGAIYTPDYEYSNFDVSDIRFTLDRLQSMMFDRTNYGKSWGTALLPGGRAAIGVAGFAVSSRTAHHELAYKLARYLNEDSRVAGGVQMTNAFTTLARTSFPEAQPIENAPYMMGGLDEEGQALLERALQNAVPYSALQHYGPFLKAVQQAGVTGTDVRLMLPEAEANARRVLEFAADRREEYRGPIPTPPPPITLAPGEVVLRFRIETLASIPDQDPLERFAADFADADPQVVQVIIDTSFGTRREDADCYYLPYNAVSITDLTEILALDPFLSADPTFDLDDMLTGTLAQVRRDDKIWAIPLDVKPLVLWYDTDSLTAAGIALPAEGWTVDTFTDALAQLESPALSGTQTGRLLLSLIAAYGGVPLDTRQSPPRVDFTSQQNVNAIQQVLDLARSGKIPYTASIIMGGKTDNKAALFADWFMPSQFQRPTGGPALLPRGTDLIPLSYELGTAYIRRGASSPEACYRFITTLANQPELLLGIPARRSTVTDAAQRPVLAAFEASLNDPDVFVIPSSWERTSFEALLPLWLYRAFDRYVLENADLEVELAEAERFTQEYVTCALALPPFDPRENSRSHYAQVRNCAEKVDPTARSFFSF